MTTRLEEYVTHPVYFTHIIKFQNLNLVIFQNSCLAFDCLEKKILNTLILEHKEHLHTCIYNYKECFMRNKMVFLVSTPNLKKNCYG